MTIVEGNSALLDIEYVGVLFAFAGAGLLIRRWVQGAIHRRSIRSKLDAQGTEVLRIKRTDSLLNIGGGLEGYARYDVLVDKGGTHQLQIWRADRNGVSRN